MKQIKIGKYKHSKSGNLYEVVGTATHSETQEVLVIYKMLYETDEYPKGFLWARPLEMFTEEVEIDGKKVLRFEFLG